MDVLILNDTDLNGSHFGCYKVMSTIIDALGQRGIKHDTVKVATKWWSNSEISSKIVSSKLVIINGEGTLHHGRKKGKWLLDAAKLAKDSGAKVALINALWQENPSSWADITSSFDLLQCRDSMSQSHLKQQTNRKVMFFGDLSMIDPWPNSPNEYRLGMLVSDSVSKTQSEKLLRFAGKNEATMMSITTTKAKLRWLSAICLGPDALAGYRNQKVAKSLSEYMNALGMAENVVTGRFHTACMALLTKTPFLALNSNSWKIEALLKDVGLNLKRRNANIRDFGTQNLLLKKFSAREIENIDHNLKKWRLSAQNMFDELASLAL